jgi:glutaredoxin
LCGFVLAAIVLIGCGSVPPATAAQRARVRVVLYTTGWCPACASLRDWLYARGIPFDDNDIESSPEAAMRHRSLNPSGAVPTIVVEGTVIHGFVPEELRSIIDTAAHRY